MVALLTILALTVAAVSSAAAGGNALADSLAADSEVTVGADAVHTVPQPPATRDQRSAEERELERIRGEIERLREGALDLRGRETGILRTLDALDREITLQNSLLSGLSRKRERVLGDLQKARDDLGRAATSLAQREALFEGRLRTMYKLGKYHEYQVLLGSTSFVDLVRRYDFLALTALRDHELVGHLVRQRAEVSRRERKLLDVAEEIARIEAEAEAEKAQMVTKREERERLLQEVRSERALREEALAELEESSARLRSLISSLEDERMISEARGDTTTGGAALAGRQGGLLWPTDGFVLEEFGTRVHPEFGTATVNNGIDIRARAGQPIRSVGRGRVDYVSTLPGYGNCVIVNHGDGFYTLYAHASEVLVEQGATVDEGQVIARVGSTGSLFGDLLHFEVREGRKPVDPLLWLRRR
jgi:murein DD-endopeptidase MepM/ murein hydrolase activator NlpD